uniref:DUF924 family protein n=1 Tax=uncultured Rhizobium sp. TaxID=155567 RepID=UPI00260E3904|nr:DUF924 family protein [uncultured Rhizobium sp.]
MRALRRPQSCKPDAAIAAVVAFWKEAGERGQWFEKDAGFDQIFRGRFFELHMEIAGRRRDGWIASPEGALALMIMTDQFPRNAFRGTGHMYATDPLARYYARQALAARHMVGVEPTLRLFFYLPFAHSEDMRDQDLSVRLNAELGEPWLEHAEGHRMIISRFGRFPHRNPVLGRVMTPEEEEFLKDGGFQG